MPIKEQLSGGDQARVDALLIRYRDSVVAAMRTALERPRVEHAALMRYHLGWQDAAGEAIDSPGGKMLRPALCLLCCEAVGGDPARAMPAAAALELVHNFTLIHDDIEDASDTRHGRETLWRVAGVAQAINAGDGMFVIAQRTLLDLATVGVSDDRALAAARLLNDACAELCEGQYADIGFETRDMVHHTEYAAMVTGKTAALLGASAAIGAIAGGADVATVTALLECGRKLGMAFQIRDDLLGIWGIAAVTGKPVADDIRSRKKTFPVVCAFSHANEEIRARLKEIYGQPEMSDRDVDETRELLEASNARVVATSEARGLADEGLALLAPLMLKAECRRDLEALAAFFVARTS